MTQLPDETTVEHQEYLYSGPACSADDSYQYHNKKHSRQYHHAYRAKTLR
jgi:hypothetical protein